jgi:hypothetical protein
VLHSSAANQVDITDILKTAECELCGEISFPNDNSAFCLEAAAK